MKYGKNNVTWQTCRPTHPFISVNTNTTAGTETQIRMKAFSIGFTRASIITSTPKKVVNCPNFLLWKRVACLDIILLKPFLMVCQNGHHIQEYWILHENNYLGTINTGNNLDCHNYYVTKNAICYQACQLQYKLLGSLIVHHLACLVLECQAYGSSLKLCNKQVLHGV